MKFFGLLWVLSYISSFFSPVIAFALPSLWAGSFLVKAVSTVNPALAGVDFALKEGVGSLRKTVTLRRAVKTGLARHSVQLARSLNSPVRWDDQTFARSSQALQSRIRSIAAVCPGHILTSLPAKSPDVRVRQNTAHALTAFQVWVEGNLVAEFPTQHGADLLAGRLQSVLQAGFDPNCLRPAVVNDRPAGKAGETLLFAVEDDMAAFLDRSKERIALDWTNSLRSALGAPPLDVADAQTQMYGLVASTDEIKGTASWYGPYFHGRLTAAGEIFNQDDFTAAHPSLPFDTFLKVTNLANGKSVVVRINDRGPYVGNRTLDLSREAARCLDSEHTGVVSYQAVIMKPSAVGEIAAAYDLTSDSSTGVSRIR